MEINEKPVPICNVIAASAEMKSLMKDPVAGKLLRRIYGSGATVEYPVLLKISDQTITSKPRFSIGKQSRGSETLERSKKLKVPKFRGSKVPTPALIDLRTTRRRHVSVIKSEIDNIEERNAAYRPPHIRPIATEREKNRLAELFTYGGGKALPSELTIPAQPIPSQVLAQKKKEENLKAKLEKSCSMSRYGGAEDILAPLFNQVANEIEERQEHLRSMRLLGVSELREQELMNEIVERTKILVKL